MKVAYQAYSKHGARTAETPREAALAFFDAFPSARKCDVIQGETDGHFFTVKYGRASMGAWPSSFRDVTKKTAIELPAGPTP